MSHETIYRTLFIQARGALKKELLQHLRRTRGMRRSRHYSMKTGTHGRIMETVSISERPAEAEDRAVPGHWEGDLLFGSNNSQIATLVERHTRYVMLVRVARKDSETVINALIKQAHKLPRELYKSLTWDRGSEMAEHKRFSLATDVKVFFCDPQQPWQRGSNENTNGLLRQYFPKGMDLADISQSELILSLVSSTNVLDRRSASRRRQSALLNALRRSIESADGHRRGACPSSANQPALTSIRRGCAAGVFGMRTVSTPFARLRVDARWRRGRRSG